MSSEPLSLLERASSIRLLALDVDGVLTDGSLHYMNYHDGSGSNGDTPCMGEGKVFDTQDGLGLRLLLDNGIEVALITGRTSPMVERRARELGIPYIHQGRNDKYQALVELSTSLGMTLEDCAYCGDDLPDLAAIKASRLGASVANAPDYIRHHADYVTEHRGGQGAVRELCELILQAQGYWTAIIEQYSAHTSSPHAAG